MQHYFSTRRLGEACSHIAALLFLIGDVVCRGSVSLALPDREPDSSASQQCKGIFQSDKR